MHDLSKILVAYLIVVLIWLVVAAFTLISIIKNKEYSKIQKIAWCAIIIAAPVLGLIMYLIYSYNRERKA